MVIYSLTSLDPLLYTFVMCQNSHFLKVVLLQYEGFMNSKRILKQRFLPFTHTVTLLIPWVGFYRSRFKNVLSLFTILQNKMKMHTKYLTGFNFDLGEVYGGLWVFGVGRAELILLWFNNFSIIILWWG